MYKDNNAFQPPDNKNVQIWRYMDFTKFISLLDKKSLYFCRLDQLGDPFEGSLTEVNVEARNTFIEELWQERINREQLAELISREPRFNEKVRQSMFVNCWHINEGENAAMWKLYLKSEEGIVIQSTYKKLKETFNNNSKEDIFFGKVNYIDYRSEAIRRDYLFNPGLHTETRDSHLFFGPKLGTATYFSTPKTIISYLSSGKKYLLK